MARRLVPVLILFLISSLVVAQDVPVPADLPDDDTAAAVDSEEGADREPPVLGFMFNAPNLLFDIDSYQGGVGARLRYPDFGIRALLSMAYGSTNSAIKARAGIVYTRSFHPGRVEPYWGVGVSGGFDRERLGTDPDNYTEVDVLSGSAVAVLGAEVFVLDFVSVFAEYEVYADLNRTTIRQAVGGVVTDGDPTTTFGFGLDIGNEAAIGITIYLICGTKARTRHLSSWRDDTALAMFAWGDTWDAFSMARAWPWPQWICCDLAALDRPTLWTWARLRTWRRWWSACAWH